MKNPSSFRPDEIIGPEQLTPLRTLLGEMAPTRRLWTLMQRIEYCRHRAEIAEGLSSNGSKAIRREMAEVARQWRDLAGTFEQLSQGGFSRPLSPKE